MSICLCNLSADTALELAAKKELELTPATPDLSSFSANPDAFDSCKGSFVEGLAKPIDILVGGAKERRRVGASAACHSWTGALPKGSILALNENVYVTAPEFTLLQQANQLHQVKLCQMLGRYLGTWTPSENSSTGQEERAPLTTFDSLKHFLSDVGSARGIQNLRLAMAYTCDGAASAPETSLQLMLSLPRGLYGFGLAQPTMNYRVDLSAEARKLCSKDFIRIDLCWRKSKFGLEYQGKGHGDKLGEDYARWFAARMEGYEMWFVAKEQLEDAAQMRYIGREVAARLGYDVDNMSLPTEEDLRELLDILSGSKNPKPLNRKELRSRHLEFRNRRRTAM